MFIPCPRPNYFPPRVIWQCYVYVLWMTMLVFPFLSELGFFAGDGTNMHEIMVCG